MTRFKTIMKQNGELILDMDSEVSDKKITIEDITKVMKISFTRMKAGEQNGEEGGYEVFSSNTETVINNLDNPATETLESLADMMLGMNGIEVIVTKID